MNPVTIGATGSATDGEAAGTELHGLLPMRAHPERYSLA
jgi:hypothetical protein